MNYKDYNDNELLSYIAENNEEATNIMFKKYEPLITSMSKKSLKYTKGAGIELNDLIQEGRLGLNNALDTFNESNDVTFYTYAKTCIERRIISLIVKCNRQKRKILNESISIEASDELGEYREIEPLLRTDISNPEKILINEATKDELIEKAYKALTDLEIQVFELKINGFSYKEIAEILDKDIKAIDNAVQRIKTKLKKEINDL